MARLKSPIACAMILVGTVFFWLPAISNAQLAETYWNASIESDWSIPDNWSTGVLPTIRNTTIINNNATVDVTTDGVACYNLYLDPGTLKVCGSVKTNFVAAYVGNSGTGRISHTAGTNAFAGTLKLGCQQGASGTYELGGTGTLTTGSFEWIGFAGSGSFIQTSGTNSVKTNFYMGNYSGKGTYELSGGQLNVILDEYVGYNGSGLLNQTGGSNCVKGDLYIGLGVYSSATYRISGNARLTAQSLYLNAPKATLSIESPDVEINVTSVFGLASRFSAVPGSSIHMTGTKLTINSGASANLAGLANLNLIVEGGAGNVLQFEVAGRDVGRSADGWVDNFALGTLTLGGTACGRMKLVNSSSNNPGWSGAEALYVSELVMLPGAQVDTGGLNLYYLNGGEAKTFILGDGNLDGLIDQADYAAYFNNYGRSGAIPISEGDFNGDAAVDQADYALYFNNYGAGGANPVPEPSTLCLMVIAGLAHFARRRR